MLFIPFCPNATGKYRYKNRKESSVIMTFYQFGRGVCRFFIPLFFHFRVEGLENVPDDRGIILCSNHRSYFDPVFLGIKLKRQLRFMAKDSLFHKPVLGVIIKHLGAFPVKRGKGDTQAIDNAVKTVQDGGLFAIFPEGTRSKTGELGKPKSGAVLVAAKTGGDIIPCCIKFEGKLHFRSKVTVTYGKVIKNEELGVREVSPTELKAASKMMMSKIAELYES